MKSYKFIDNKVVSSNVEDSNLLIFNLHEQDKIKEFVPKFVIDQIIIKDKDKHYHNSLEIFHTNYYGELAFPLHFLDNESTEFSGYFYVNQKYIVFMFDTSVNDDKFINTLNRTLKNQLYLDDSNLYLLVLIFNLFINDINKQISVINKKVTNLENSIILNSNERQYNYKMLAVRRSLDKLRVNVNEIEDAFQILSFKADDKFNEYITLIQQKIQRASSNIQVSFDNITQLKQMYQSLLDFSLNNSLNILTVISFVFLPLTFIVGWYGMNLELPAFVAPHNMWIPIILSIISIIVSIYIVRKYTILSSKKGK